MHSRFILKTNNKSYLYVSLTKIDDTFKSELHSHDNLEILLIKSGKGSIITSNQRIDVTSKDLIILNSNSYHYEDGTDLTFYAIGISKLNFFLRNDFSKKIIKLSLNENNYKNILSLYDNVYNEALNNKEDSNEIIENLINLIILSLKREESIVNNNNNSDDNVIVSNIKAIIDNYYSSNIKLDDISYRLSLSKSLICHVFKKEVGKSIIDYKIEKQLEEAKNMLEISDMPINLICDMVGFNSQSYFIKKFKEKYNIKPNDIRKKKALKAFH